MKFNRLGKILCIALSLVFGMSSLPESTTLASESAPTSIEAFEGTQVAQYQDLENEPQEEKETKKKEI